MVETSRPPRQQSYLKGTKRSRQKLVRSFAAAVCGAALKFSLYVGLLRPDFVTLDSKEMRDSSKNR
jgi:hypothetical protein